MDNLIKGAVNKIKQFATNTFNTGAKAVSQANTNLGNFYKGFAITPQTPVPTNIQKGYNFAKSVPVIGGGVIQPVENFAKDYWKYQTSKAPLLSQQGVNEYTKAMGSGLNAYFAVQGGKNILTGGIKPAVTNLGITAGLGGIINKVGGGSFIEGAKQGLNTAPTIQGIAGFTNPVIQKGADVIGSKLVNPVASNIAGRIASGVGNIPEGMVMRQSLGGGKYTLQDALMDFGTGVLLQPPTGKIKVKGAYEGPLIKEDRSKIRSIFARMKDGWIGENGEINFKQQAEDLDFVKDVLKDKYFISEKEIKQLGNNGIIEELHRIVRQDVREPQIQMGITEQQPSTPQGGVKIYRGSTKEGPYFSTSKNIAEDYIKQRGGKLVESTLPSNSKIANYSDFPNASYKGIDDYNVQKYASSHQKNVLDFMNDTLEQDYKKATKWAKQNGYDAIRLPTEGEIRVINKNVISQPSTPQGVEQPSFLIKATKDGKIKVKTNKQDITPDVLKTQSAPPPSVPPGKGKVKGLPTSEEVAATLNDKIDLLLENTAGYSTKAPTGGQKGVSLYTRILRGAEGKMASTVEKGMVSQNPLIRRASSVLHGLFKEFGMSPEHMKQALEFKGGLSTANQQAYDVMDSLYQALGKNPQSKARIDAVLDPEASKLKVSFNDLDETEKAVYSLIRQGYDLIHDISYANGGISPEVYKKNLGKYSARLYSEFELPAEVNKFINQSPKRLQTDLYRNKGSLTEWKKENKLDDPIYALGKRLSQVESNRAVKKYTDFIASQPHLISDVARPGFSQLSDSPAYGSLRGKYVANSAMEELKGYFFANKGLQSLYDVFREYDKLPLRQLQKKLLTVFNPTTNVGNITTDNVFGFLVGVDPFTLNKNIVNFKRNPSEYKKIANYLMSQGITGTDITRSDFISKIGSIDELQKGTKLNIADKIKEFYGGTDDVYKAAAFKSLLDQGKTIQEATTLVSDGFQNYANVGKLYDLASKTPIIGQPFIKFQGDLVRIMKNAAVNKPLQLIQFLAALKAISILSSKASGETDEQRTARENRFGANKIPGLDISLQWQTPMGEINIARYISPFYTTNLSENTTTQALNKFVPFSPEIIKDSTGKLDFAGTISANANDPFTSVPIQLLADRDFRNKPISDPKASKFFGSDLPEDEQMKNKLIWAGRQYLPPVANTAIDIKAATEGKPDLYGKQRTVPQAIARALGVKVEQATPEIVKKQAETSKYFEAQGPAFNTLKAQEKAAVLSIPKQEPDDTKDKVYKYTTMLQYPAVYNYMKDIAVGKADGNMKKVDPLYTFSYSDIRKYMTYQALGGSDYGSPDAKALYKAEPVIAEIAKARSEYFKANPIEGTSQSSRPLPSAYAQQQMSVGNWNDPQVKAYLEANNAWKNMQREKAGLPPLEALSGGYGKYGAYTKKPKKVAIKAVKKAKIKKFTLKAMKSPKLKTLKKTMFKVAKTKQPKIKVKMPRLA